VVAARQRSKGGRASTHAPQSLIASGTGSAQAKQRWRGGAKRRMHSSHSGA
jgi:hypothetical protein